MLACFTLLFPSVQLYLSLMSHVHITGLGLYQIYQASPGLLNANNDSQSKMKHIWESQLSHTAKFL